MGITDHFDKIIKKRQEQCEHNYQDRVITPDKIFCGKCSLEEKRNGI